MSTAKSKDLFEQVRTSLIDLYGTRESTAIAKNYLADRFHVDNIKLVLNTEISYDESLLKNDLNRLVNGAPYQHVIGYTFFYNRYFMTNRHALIPRPETEELVNWIVDDNEMGNPKILDVGTGSGCIAISLRAEIPDSICSGVDISNEALELAKENAKKNGVDVGFSILDILNEDISSGYFDIIVSNPPYIPVSDKSSMHKNVLAHEPETALFVEDDNPLIFYETIASKAKNVLKPGGKLYFEIHENSGQQMTNLLTSLGYGKVELRKDLQDKDRMIKASQE